MKERRVRFTATAQRQVNREKSWWRENRDYPNVFATDLEAALRVLAILPGVGTSYERAGIPALRRLYLRKIDCHLYYTFDDEDVIIRALWAPVGMDRRAWTGNLFASFGLDLLEKSRGAAD